MVFKYEGKKYSLAATKVFKGCIVPDAINKVSIVFINLSLGKAEQSRVLHKLLKRNNLQDIKKEIVCG
ncbi:hypothetical protein SAMN02745248_01505 [Hathewaya proteolytica DSM 3090]|uniref:Uncharacterized protein n=1 Tax=Hathewaya proteolytica DSM 3090 TaxID=1121331 RepID=A0A1M6NUL1_9CLOT|nr:hypothetical protein [Hathewaya proteolytica]SHJ99439.1 hypothetical protein SAMN02745248_01505 [Hathewaya proteolytica DSM 3090]